MASVGNDFLLQMLPRGRIEKAIETRGSLTRATLKRINEDAVCGTLTTFPG